jgi:RND family efflux transporter MFP subunit
VTTNTGSWWLRKRQMALCCCCLALLSWAGLNGTTASPPPAPAKQEPVPSPAPESPSLEATGKTQCILTRKFVIAPVPLHPVTEVLVEPGSRVKKGQPLVKLDDDEPQADVRAKEAALESAKIASAEARRHLEVMEKTFLIGSSPEQRFHEIRVTALKAEKDERAAKAALDSAKAELEHFEVTAQIDGVVSWLKVHPGMVSRPGTSVWGEILDLREIDVCTELTLEQVQRVSVGQTAYVTKKGQKDALATGRVVFVGITVDRNSERVPVHVRLTNPEERLRCEEPVQVRFTSGAK